MTTQYPLQIKRGAEPFLLDGGDVGCICTHGFTASPEEMRWLGESLHEHGLTVFAPRLAGHGTDPGQMRRQTWLDWYENVLDGVALLRKRCRKVVAVGLSMGGLLSLRAGAAGEVDGVVAMAAPLYMNKRSMRYARFLQLMRPYWPKANWPGDLDKRVRETQRQMSREDYGRGDYGVIPTASAAQLWRLMVEVRSHLHEITVPLLLIYSRGDQTVPYDNMALVAAHVRSVDVVQKTLERSGHCLLQEIERETVYEMVWNFMQRDWISG